MEVVAKSTALFEVDNRWNYKNRIGPKFHNA